MNFTPFPILQSTRLLLKNITASDCDEILFLRSDKTVNQFIERPEHRQTKNKQDALKLIKELDGYRANNKSIVWGISLKGNSKVIGSICLWNFAKNNTVAELGYDLSPTFQKQGIMSESLKMVLDYGFNTLKLKKIEAFTHTKNESSKILLEKNGFLLNIDRKDAGNGANIIFELENHSNI